MGGVTANPDCAFRSNGLAGYPEDTNCLAGAGYWPGGLDKTGRPSEGYEC